MLECGAQHGASIKFSINLRMRHPKIVFFIPIRSYPFKGMFPGDQLKTIYVFFVLLYKIDSIRIFQSITHNRLLYF